MKENDLSPLEPLDYSEDEDFQIQEVKSMFPNDEDFAAKLRQVVDDFVDVFSAELPRDGAKVPPMVLTLTPDATVKAASPRGLSPMLEAEVAKQVKELLSSGVIEPSTSSCSSPVLLIRNPAGGYRFCVGYRSLNAATVRMQNLLPNYQQLLAGMSGKKLFCVLDLRSGFFQ